jgi:transposase
MNFTIFIGLDAHKATVSAGIAGSSRGAEVRHLGTFENRVDVLTKVVQRLARGGRRLNFCYEVGPCGLYRLLRGLGHDCIVVAPSLIPMGRGASVDRPAGRFDVGKTSSRVRIHGGMGSRCHARSDA